MEIPNQVSVESMMEALQKQRADALDQSAQYHALALDQAAQIKVLTEENERLKRLQGQSESDQGQRD